MKNRFMKTGMIALVLCLSATAFSGCEDGTEAADTAAKKSSMEICAEIVGSDIAFPEMVEVNEDNFQLRYGLGAEDYTEYGLYWAGDGAMADEVCVIKTSGGDQLNKVKTAVETRRDAQANLYQDYAPDQADRIRASSVTTKNNYVFWSVSDGNDAAAAIFEKAFE